MNSFLSLTSHSRTVKLLAVFAALLLGLCFAEPSGATMSQYRMTVGSGTLTNMSSANTLWQGYPGIRGDYGYYPTYAGYYNFGFNFNFDGANYSQCVIYTSGIISLGSTINNSYPNRNLSGLNTPTIAPLWYFMTPSGDQGDCFDDPRVSFLTIGSAPNRVFVVQWYNWEVCTWAGGTSYGYGHRGTWEARLYESQVSGEAGKIEFFYQYLGQNACAYYGTTSHHIGMGTSSSNYLFVSYSGSTPALSYTGSPAGINVVSGSARPSAGALYTFTKLPNVQFSVTPKSLNFGTVSSGATVDMCVTVRHAGTEGSLQFQSATLAGSSAFSIISSPSGPLGTPGQTSQYCIRFAPTTNGTHVSVLTILTNGLDSGQQQVLLTGDAIAPTMEVSPIGENFANRMFRKTRLRLGDTVEQGILVKNIGAGQLVISPATMNLFGDYPQFYWVSRLPDAALTPGVSDTLFVKFSPRQEGLLPAKMTIVSNSSTGNYNVDFVGVGVIPRIVVTPDPMIFDSVRIGTSDTMKFTICNPGSDTLRLLRNYMSSGDPDFVLYPLTGTDMVIAPEKCREVMVVFTPRQMGIRVARFAVQTNIPLTFDDPRRDTASNVLYYDITGTGIPTGVLYSADIRADGIVDSVLLNTKLCRTTTVTNTGDADVTITSATFAGAAAADYTMEGITLPYVLKAKSSVNVQICATPTTRGSNLVDLTISGTTNEQLTTLKGTVDIIGLEACVTPAPATAFDGTLTPHNVMDSVEITITNCGDFATTYTPTITGPEKDLYKISPAVSPMVDRQGTTTFWVYFTPTTSGVKPATVNFVGTNVTTSVTLNGEGACSILDPVQPVEATATPANGSSAFSIVVTNSGNLPWEPGTPVISSPAFKFVGATGTPIPGNGGQGTLNFTFDPPSWNRFTGTITFPDAQVCGNALEINVAGDALRGSVDVVSVEGYVLTQNAPNPAVNGTTSFSYTVPNYSNVRIMLADVTGKMVRELVNTSVTTGTYTVDVNTTGLASGTYLYIMEAGNARLVKQMVISK